LCNEVRGNQARVKNSDLRHLSFTVVMQKRKKRKFASPVLSVLSNTTVPLVQRHSTEKPIRQSGVMNWADSSFIIHGSQPNNKFKPKSPSAKEPIAFAVRIEGKDIVRKHN
jgi:hypothetical protein